MRPRPPLRARRVWLRQPLTRKALADLHHAKHALGPAVYAAVARELAPGNESIAEEEIRWAIEHASPAVREIVSRWPARVPGRTRLSALYYAVDAGLRS